MTRVVLVVDDEPAVLLLAARGLEQAGFRVLSATNGQEAIDLAERFGGTVDVAVLDFIMPGMTGPELMIHLTHLLPAARFVMMSAYASDTLEWYGSNLLEGRDFVFIEKPFSTRELIASIEKSLAN
jgi:two-component system cell cycle sensor histidine kinase/response regulator CckA